MKKTLLGVLALVGLAATLSAASVELKVQVSRDTPENQARLAAEMDRIERFKAKYPDITVKPVHMAYDNTGEFFVLQAAGKAPDVLNVWATEAQMMARKKWALPLDSYINAWEKKSWYNLDSFKPFTVSGKIYGVPENNYVKHVLYNKAMFKAAGVPFPKDGWTWDDFINAAVKTTNKAKGIAGFAPMGRGGESGWGFSDFIYQAGAEIESLDGSGKANAVYNSAEAIRAAQLFKDLRWKYDVIPANWSNGWGDVYNLFGAGQAAMVLDGDSGRNIAVNSLKMDPANIGVVTMPKGSGPKGRAAGVMGGNYWIINATTAKTKQIQDAAWKWIDFERFDEAGLANVKAEIEDHRANGQYRCIFYYWPLLPNAPYAKAERALLEANADAAVAWGDEAFLKALPGTAHIEPPVAAQDVYGKYLSNVVQILFSEKDADPAKVMKDSAAKFQKEVLDPYNKALK